MLNSVLVVDVVVTKKCSKPFKTKKGLSFFSATHKCNCMDIPDVAEDTQIGQNCIQGIQVVE